MHSNARVSLACVISSVSISAYSCVYVCIKNKRLFPRLCVLVRPVDSNCFVSTLPFNNGNFRPKPQREQRERPQQKRPNGMKITAKTTTTIVRMTVRVHRMLSVVLLSQISALLSIQWQTP